MKTGYCITTKRFALRCRHPEWFLTTQELFNQVLYFYYQLLLKHPELHTLNNQKILRELEILSVPGRDNHSVPDPLPWDGKAGEIKIPLYFRRSAINGATALVKSCLNRSGYTNPAEKINAAVVYYKGMYRKLTETEITLKVFNREKWHWMSCRLSGNHLPDGSEVLSPTIVIKGEKISLHVPIREVVTDIRTSKERIAAKENICSIQFTNSDAFAVACVLASNGKQLAIHFFKGGKEYSHRCEEILEKIRKSEESRRRLNKEGDFLTENPEGEKTNQKYWMHLKHLSDHYAHQISRQVITFCKEQEVGLIIITPNDGKYSRAVLKAAGNWSPLHLSVRIRKYLSYKAWKEGIVVLEKMPEMSGRICSICGASITKRKEMYVCSNGHTGNRYLNTAKNLGKACLEDFWQKGIR